MEYGYLGQDIRLDLATGDVESLPAGDLFSVKASDLVLQDLWLRLTTPKGDLWCHPEYGVDIYQYLHLEATLANRMALCAAIREEARKDPRIKPESVTVTIKDWNAQTHSLEVLLTFQIEGSATVYDLVLGYDLRDIDENVLFGDGGDGVYG